MPLLIPIPKAKGGTLLVAVFTPLEICRVIRFDPPVLTGAEIAPMVQKTERDYGRPGDFIDITDFDMMIAFEEDRDVFLAWLAEKNRSAGELMDRFSRGHIEQPGDGDPATDWSALIHAGGLKQ